MKLYEILGSKEQKAGKKWKLPASLRPQGGPALSLYDKNRIRLKLKSGELPQGLKRQAESVEG